MGCSASKAAGVDLDTEASVEERFNSSSIAQIDPTKYKKITSTDLEISLGCFANVKRVRWLAEHCPEILLFPWEYQRVFGVVKPGNPMKIKYTFLSHQWETPGHPFPDLKQITENLGTIETDWMRVDWWCTMASFQKLCAHSHSAIAVVKHPPTGLTMRGYDKEKGSDIGAEITACTQKVVKDMSKKAGAILTKLSEEICGAGLDFEYSIRAWCCLERCYLPAAPHKDSRIVALLPLIAQMRTIAEGSITKKASKKEQTPANTALNELLGAVERLEGLIKLC